MNNNAKIGAGVSLSGALLLIFHFLRVAHSVSTIGDKDENEVFKNAPVYFIQTDSTGKKDTMLMKDYLRKVK